MKIYWSNNAVPELQGLDKHKQIDLRYRAIKANRYNPRLWLGLLAIFAIHMGIFTLITFNIHFSLLLSPIIQFTTTMIFIFCFNQYIIRLIRPHLRLYRTELDKPRSNNDNDYFVPPAL
ncbi:hypothetical protein [Herpetosiphon giganteus]|uniref:hypothetical protein n=1 Tax=Herpetosiphon giganteus TaxID=2029754 RepID=UPI00195E1AA2|nr:hypothetical protein [Herpetosiphon giganteus]MBM7844460.1 hypothetical protein [Herpetosiphon giganteus]